MKRLVSSIAIISKKERKEMDTVVNHENRAINLLRVAIVLTVATAIVAILGITLIVRSSADSEPEAEPMPVQDVVSMLEDDGMDILLVNSRENSFPIVLESVDIVFQIDNPVPTEDRVESIVNTFETLDNRDAWLEISQGFDGVAVVRGDELWAVSVDSDLANSREIAEQLANTLNGEVR